MSLFYPSHQIKWKRSPCWKKTPLIISMTMPRPARHSYTGLNPLNPIQDSTTCRASSSVGAKSLKLQYTVTQTLSVQTLALRTQHPSRETSERTTAARCAVAPSDTRATTRNTAGCTQGRSRTAARCVGRASVSRATWRCTCATTRERSRLAAATAANGSATRVTWRNTNRHTCEGVLQSYWATWFCCDILMFYLRF